MGGKVLEGGGSPRPFPESHYVFSKKKTTWHVHVSQHDFKTLRPTKKSMLKSDSAPPYQKDAFETGKRSALEQKCY